MGLCFETVHQDKMAAEAYRQAWNTLLEQRAEGRRKSPGGGARSTTKGNNGGLVGEGGSSSSGGRGNGEKEKGEETIKGGDDCDEIGMILLQAKMDLTTCSSSRGTSKAGGWSRGSTPQQLRQLQQQQSRGGTPGLQGAENRSVSFER